MAVSPKLLSILGPTASGKSDLALALARQTGSQILSADSMQVYRGMDIGTAKLTPAQRATVIHHLIDIVDPTESFTVAKFVELADSIIATAKSPLIIAGGTPLYYKSLFEGLFDGPPADESIRQRLRTADPADLHARLAAVDPQAAARIHLNDRKRLIRALEVYELTGRPISSFQTDWESGHSRHPATWIGLSWDREALNRRINARVKSMIESGWLDETRSLLQHHGQLSPTASEATGYRELIEHLHGRLSLEDAIEQIKIATRQLARRQMKWLKRFPNVHWIAGDAPLESQVTEVLARWP
ncbi:MAG TPA: tRNA (adenosine(37)-N6)-dimethylallyltransferase MiaA [Tepidisphaeraceae bacterium]|jgi:tRNA dimethylallyltransferase|nr:tRNA (adenosine(37)-N6)-dimethylallyltransferase MiaA [Tepidisphaeraceae bacterium]